MSLFLTTQHLEEADALADRVGIIDADNLVAEGTPAELKRSIAVDVITAHIDGDVAAAMKALAGMEGATSVDHYGSEVRVSATNGGRLLSPVALALDRAGVSVRELAMRSPTLDDVFLDVTGHHLERGAP